MENALAAYRAGWAVINAPFVQAILMKDVHAHEAANRSMVVKGA